MKSKREYIREGRKLRAQRKKEVERELIEVISDCLTYKVIVYGDSGEKKNIDVFKSISMKKLIKKVAQAILNAGYRKED